MEYVREAILEDAKTIAPLLRQADIQEIRASSGKSPVEALTLGVLLGKPTYTFTSPQGELGGMFGVLPTAYPEAGAVWLLATGEVEKYPMTFLRHSREWIKTLHEDYPLLFNYVDGRNSLHIKWLKWMGFTFIRRHPEYGVEKRSFFEFVRMVKPNV